MQGANPYSMDRLETLEALLAFLQDDSLVGLHMFTIAECSENMNIHK
jgi:hypothetical protein